MCFCDGLLSVIHGPEPELLKDPILAGSDDASPCGPSKVPLRINSSIANEFQLPQTVDVGHVFVNHRPNVNQILASRHNLVELPIEVRKLSYQGFEFLPVSNTPAYLAADSRFARS